MWRVTCDFVWFVVHWTRIQFIHRNHFSSWSLLFTFFSFWQFLVDYKIFTQNFKFEAFLGRFMGSHHKSYSFEIFRRKWAWLRQMPENLFSNWIQRADHQSCAVIISMLILELLLLWWRWSRSWKKEKLNYVSIPMQEMWFKKYMKFFIHSFVSSQRSPQYSQYSSKAQEFHHIKWCWRVNIR